MRFLTAACVAASALLVTSSPSQNIRAQDVIDKLGLEPHPEKGYYKETFQDPATIAGGNRSYSSAIYYFLEGKVGHAYWHRVDAAEVWHYYGGAPLELEMSWNNGTATTQEVLGGDIFDGQSPQVIIPANQWQRARSLGEWTLVGTTVAPAFSPDTFEMPDPGNWTPDDGSHGKSELR